MGRKIPERYVWAVDLLEVQPDDAILEIGCGYGHSIPLICEKLKSGKLTAIDRSVAMSRAAAKAHASFVCEGKAKIIHTDLLDFVPETRFDKIFLFNINVFWMDPVNELLAIRRLLRPNGTFYIFHKPPPDHDVSEFAHEFRKNLKANNFNVFKEINVRIGNRPIVAVVSSRL